MSLAPGTRLDPYQIVPLLGAGGMGEVYRAQDVLEYAHERGRMLESRPKK